jgi:hypothetical protein
LEDEESMNFSKKKLLLNTSYYHPKEKKNLTPIASHPLSFAFQESSKPGYLSDQQHQLWSDRAAVADPH